MTAHMDMADQPTGRDFGRLEAQVEALHSDFGNLSRQMTLLSEKMDSLTTLAERGKGAYWAAALIASAIGGGIVMLYKVIKGSV